MTKNKLKYNNVETENIQIEHFGSAAGDFFKKAGKWVTSTATNAGNAIVDTGTSAANTVAETATSAANTVAETATSAANTVAETATTAVNLVADGFNDLTADMIADVKKIPDLVKGVAAFRAIGDIPELIKTNISTVTSYADGVLTKATTYADTLKTKVENEISNDITTLGNDITQGIQTADNYADGILTKATTYADGVYTQATTYADKLKTEATTYTDAAKAALKVPLDEVTKLTNEAKAGAKDAIRSLKAAGIKIGSEVERTAHKAINFVKREEKLIEKKIKKGFNEFKNKFKHFINKLKNIFNFLGNVLNDVLDYIEWVYFFFCLVAYGVPLAVMFVMVDLLNVWNVFGSNGMQVSFAAYFSVMFYFYYKGYFTLDIDPKKWINEITHFLKNPKKDIEAFIHAREENVKWVYFIITAYIYAVLVAICIEIVALFLPLTFNFLGKEYAPIIRNFVFYTCLNYLYKQGYFTLNINPLEILKNLWKNLKDTKSILNNIKERILSVIQYIYFIFHLSKRSSIVTVLFWIYGTLDIWSVFGESSGTMENAVYYFIIFYRVVTGEMSLKKEPKQWLNDIQEFFTNPKADWKAFWQYVIDSIQWIYFVVVSYTLALLVCIIILIIPTVSNIFLILGPKNSLLVRNIFFYVVLYGLFDRGYMTIDVKEANPWTWLKNLWYIMTHPLENLKKYVNGIINFEEKLALTIISIIKFTAYYVLIWLWMNVLNNSGIFEIVLGKSLGLNFGNIILVLIMIYLYVAKAF